MASHGTSSTQALNLSNSATALQKSARRSSQVTPSRSFMSDRASEFFPEEIPLDPHLPNSGGADSYSYYDYSRSNLTFGAGFGADTNGARIEIPGNDGTSYTVPVSDPANMELDAMSRFERAPDPVPWIGPNSVEGMRGWKTTSQIIRRPQDAYSGYRNGPASDMGTSYSHARNDSGYISRSYHESEQLSQQGEDTRSVHQRIEHTRMIAEGVSLGFPSDLHPGIGGTDDSIDAETATAASTRSWHIQSSSGQHRCQHPDCRGSKAMNPSEYRKHMQRHNKPFRCSVPSCKRSINGFATLNDLARHTKSVHHELSASASERSFICRGNRCTHRSKIWPRLDNFKAHCKRRHRSEDLDDLVRRSAFDSRIQDFVADTHHGDHLPDLTEKSFSADHTITLTDGDGANRPIYTVASLSADTIAAPNHQPANAVTVTPSENISTRSEQLDAELMNLQGPNLHITQTQAHRGWMLGQYNTLAGLITAADAQKGSQTWHMEIEELEKDLISAFTTAQECGQQPTPNELGAIAKAHIMDFLKAPRKRMASEAGLDAADETANKQEVVGDQTSLPQPRIVKCGFCSKEMSRLCDLKKHEKRHLRPWGCTDEKCNKTFGSKNDWKRHENSQHYQLETWRCHEVCESSLIGVCAKIFFRQDPFRAHLRKEHGISGETYMRDQCRQRRIGRNWQDRFWCGFCRAIVKLQQKGLKAWDERFNHIDDYHFKKGESIELWYPLDKDIPKGRIRRQRNARYREAVGGNDSSQLQEDNKDSANATDNESDLSTDRRSSTPPPPPPEPSPPRDLSLCTSSPQLDEDHPNAVASSDVKLLKRSAHATASSIDQQSRATSRKDDLKVGLRQASLSFDNQAKGEYFYTCRGCATPINPEIDPSCPECGMRLPPKYTNQAATQA